MTWQNEAIRAGTRECLNVVPHAIFVRIPAICESRTIAAARIFIGAAETASVLIVREESYRPKNWQTASDIDLAYGN